MIVPVPSFPTGQVPPMAARPEPGAPEGAAPGFAALMSAQQGRAAQGDAAQTEPPKATTPLDELQGDLEAVAQDGLARLVAAGGDETAQAEAIVHMQTGLSETIAAFDAAHGTELGGLLPSGTQEADALPAMVFSVPPGSAQAVAAVQAAMGGAGPERAIAALTRMSNLLDTAATAMGMDPSGSTTAGPMAVASGIMPSATAPSATALSTMAPSATGASTATLSPTKPSPATPSTATAFMPAEASGDPSAPMQPLVPAQDQAAPRGVAMIAAEPRQGETPAGLVTEKAAAPGQPAPSAGTTISQPSAPLSFSALVSEAALLGGEAGAGGQDLAAVELPGSEPGAARGT
ncbi:hypothetical protein NHG85_09765, partial [Limimaricola sp. ASW11-118]|nr:hypothetical protein [Limimaricola litoreus]